MARLLLLLSVCIGAVLVGLVCFQKLTEIQEPPEEPSKSAFELSLNQKGKIIYDFYWGDTIHKRYEYWIRLNSIDVPSKSIGIDVSEGFVDKNYETPDNLALGEKITCFETEEGGGHIRLVEIGETKAIFETWFEIGPPHLIGPLAPKEIIIEE